VNRGRRIPAGVPLAALVALATLVIARYGLDYHLRQNDELNAIIGSRFLQLDFPEHLWSRTGYGDRGPERLTAWYIALTDQLAATTAGDFQVGHVAMALAWAAIALPVYALARGIGLRPWPALVPAAMCAAGAWAIFGITFLNTSLGLLTASVQLYVLWRVTVRPSVRWELAVLGVFGLAVAARVGHAPLALALAPALLVQAWRDRPPGQAAGRFLRAAPGVVARRWPVLTVAGGLGLLLVIAVGQSGLLGTYGSGLSSVRPEPGRLWEQSQSVLGRTALATGFLPVALGVPWLVREAVAPRDREAGAFAVLGLGTVLILLYVLYTAAIEERYLVVMLPVVALAFARALFARELSWVAGLAFGAWAAWSASRQREFIPETDPFTFFVSPGATFLRRVVVNRTDLLLPVDAGASRTLLFAGAAVLAGAVAFAVTRGPARARPAVTAATALAVVAWGAVAGIYAMHKFTREAAYSFRTWDGLTFVDAVAGPDGSAGLIADDPPIPGVDQKYYDIAFFNRSLDRTLRVDGRFNFTCCPPALVEPLDVATNRRTGQVAVTGGAVPELLAVPMGFRTYGFNTERVSTGEPGFALERRRGPLQLSFVAPEEDVEPDGWARAGDPLRRRVFPAAAGPDARRACWTGMLSGPALADGPVEFTARAGAAAVRGTLAPRTPVPVAVPLAPGRAAVALRIRTNRSGRLDDGRRVTLLATDEHVEPCPDTGPAAGG
jgi:hypothetical protein